MCTLTWRFHTDGYELHFNRDESRLRPKAIPAKIDLKSKPQVISPTDPRGGGSWIAVNQFGLSVCLLNNYQGLSNTSRETQNLTSRGLLVSLLGKCHNIDDALSKFSDFDLTNFRAFEILLFFPSFTPLRISWNGASANITETIEGFTSSSGYQPESVISGRRKQFLEYDDSDLFELHSSHEPERSAYSVCMHRADARTQSYSKVSVGSQECHFWYADGPPCTAPVTGPISLPRTSSSL